MYYFNYLIEQSICEFVARRQTRDDEPVQESLKTMTLGDDLAYWFPDEEELLEFLKDMALLFNIDSFNVTQKGLFYFIEYNHYGNTLTYSLDSEIITINDVCDKLIDVDDSLRLQSTLELCEDIITYLVICDNKLANNIDWGWDLQLNTQLYEIYEDEGDILDLLHSIDRIFNIDMFDEISEDIYTNSTVLDLIHEVAQFLDSKIYVVLHNNNKDDINEKMLNHPFNLNKVKGKTC